MRSLPAFLLFTGSAVAASGPENVVVLVNGDSWASVTIANEYRAAREIPSDHFIVLRDLPSFEQMPVAEFREKILLPALKEAEKRGLGPQLDYLLYSSDFPTAIDVSADMAGKTFPKQITQPASINGLTYFYQFTLARNPIYLGLNSNFYFRQVAKSAPNAPLSEAFQPRYAAAMKKLQETTKELEQAGATGAGGKEEVLRGLLAELQAVNAENSGRSEVLYNIACVESRLNRPDAAMTALRQAFDHGWWDIRQAQMDPDLRAVHGRADFKELAERAKQAKFDLWPTSGFRGSVGWMPTGQPVAPMQGARYLLSTTLGHTSGRGMSVPEVVNNLTRSAKADGSRPQGTVYFLENDDVRSTTREWAFVRTAEKLKEIGVSASIERGVLPSGRKDVIGLTAGSERFAWKDSGSTILPGAICEHLTSCGGMLGERDGQTPLTEFLRNGAAGASGTVAEPYAIQAKFPTAFLHYHYAQGCTLAEAFFQSVAGPYQLLIVGDALCAPWKKRITVTATEVPAGATIRGKVSFSPSAVSPDGVPISHFELHVNGKRAAIAKAGTPVVFDSTTVADGARELQLVATGADALATTGRLVIPCVIQNGKKSVFAQTAAAATGSWDQPVKVNARAAGAKRIALRQLGREVGALDAAEGEISVDPRLLGQGPVEVQPVGVWEDGSEVYGAPLRFRVVAPKPLPAQEVPSGQKLAKGFTVKPSGAPAFTVQKMEGDWRKTAGVREDGEFSIEGWFSVDADDVYQFQVRGADSLKVNVDGVTQEWPRGKEWWFVPVALSKGLHRVKIEAKGALDVRFGGPGSYQLNGDRFQHLE